MKCYRILFLAAALAGFSSCAVDPLKEYEVEKPQNIAQYEYLNDYDVLKNYVDRAASPDFKLGAALAASDFTSGGQVYALAVSNFDEMTAGNEMKYASIVANDGTMAFDNVRNFVNAAADAGMTVYGHTLAWHSQQNNKYLNSLIADKEIEIEEKAKAPTRSAPVISRAPAKVETILALDFEDGQAVFNGWGNNSTRTVENGALKITNPSAVNSWEAQMAYDFSEPFVNGQKYKMSFKIKGSAEGTIGAGFQITSNYASAGDFGNVNFTTEWQDVELSCTCTADEATRLIFSFGAFAGDIFIDDFRFWTVEVFTNTIPQTPEEKKANLTVAMDNWIKGMMEVTAEKVSAWDVVNEAISGVDGDGDGWYDLQSASNGDPKNNFYWQDYLGNEDYVRIVVEKARKYYAEFGGTAPLKLFINDYNLESDWDDNKKLKSLIHWIEVWESDGVTKIDGIATQMHVSCYENQQVQDSKKAHVVEMFKLMAETGKLVKISELDMGYVDANGNTVPTTSMTEEQHKAMAEYYKFIVSEYFKNVPAAQQYGITQWCLTDASGELGTGWRGGEPVGLWDLNFNRKHTYAGFAAGLQGE